MTNGIPTELLQPCLLDRLTDDEPFAREESRMQRVISLQRYRRGVLRDLEWLLNSHAFFPPLTAGDPDLRNYPEAWRSVINFGTRQLYGLSAPDLDPLREQLSEAIRIFEPRIVPRSLIIQAHVSRNLLTLEIEGELWAHPMTEHLHVKTTLDLETSARMEGEVVANG